MDLIFSKAFLEQALYEMGPACNAIRVNPVTNKVSLMVNIYSAKPIEEMCGFETLKTKDTNERKINTFVSSK